MIGTATLVFLGCLGVCKGLGQPGDHMGVVLSFGLAVFIAVQITCNNSGSHVNPAVTVMSLFFKKLNFPMAAVYILGQLIGAVIGYGLLKAVNPSNLLHANGFEEYGVCTTVPHPEISAARALLAEFLFTSILLLVVCSAWDPRNSHFESLSLKFGFTVFSLAYAGAAYSGCSMNPARSFGPAIWNQTWKDHWVYWVGPILAGLVWGFTYTRFFCPKLSPLTEDHKQLKKGEMEMNVS
ncbi:Aquaporin-4, putative [Pediculus humanus corporis]|uniref:Aquaporin-4, putative n=1 Tax=Pediculus humanus subsp. corporis TaxID=121224 RepID=E0VPZ5_PEDHC|nr:Aquaporin-4, putative [Pediculus humanus corporis]EEB15451.1 Aquaporin-4, putative [Pediculus humanus corporis]